MSEAMVGTYPPIPAYDDHPANKCYRVLFLDDPDIAEEEHESIPNYGDVRRYLAQLPTNTEYQLWYEEDEVEIPEHEDLGFMLWFEDKEKCSYGLLQMLRLKDGKLGASMCFNAGGSTSPSWYLLPTK